MGDFSRHDPFDGSSSVATTSGRVGTAGCFVRVGSDAICILGSAHVLTGGRTGASDIQVFHPPAARPDSIHVARVWDSFGPDRSGRTKSVLDAAIAVVASGVAFDPRIGDLGRPAGFNPNMQPRQRVHIHGAGSGRPTSGQIQALNDSTTVAYDDGSQASFSGLVRCERYSVGGDSGAAVLDADNYVLGVHLCGTKDYSWFCPIDMVTARWPPIELIIDI